MITKNFEKFKDTIVHSVIGNSDIRCLSANIHETSCGNGLEFKSVFHQTEYKRDFVFNLSYDKKTGFITVDRKTPSNRLNHFYKNTMSSQHADQVRLIQEALTPIANKWNFAKSFSLNANYFNSSREHIAHEVDEIDSVKTLRLEPVHQSVDKDIGEIVFNRTIYGNVLKNKSSKFKSSPRIIYRNDKIESYGYIRLAIERLDFTFNADPDGSHFGNDDKDYFNKNLIDQTERFEYACRRLITHAIDHFSGCHKLSFNLSNDHAELMDFASVIEMSRI